MTLTFEEYARRDYRLKCRRCGRWMRDHPTASSPARRRPAPDAALCVDCPLWTKQEWKAWEEAHR